MNGMMYKVIVYSEGLRVGTGYFIHYVDGDTSEADLISDVDGSRLPEGWYQLKVTDDIFAVVVPTREQ